MLRLQKLHLFHQHPREISIGSLPCKQKYCLTSSEAEVNSLKKES